MTPTDEQLKKLAENVAEFLDLEISSSEAFVCTLPFPAWGAVEVAYKDFFDSDTISPILGHLAKREMEKRGWELQHETYWQPGNPNWIDGPTIHEISYRRVEDGHKQSRENKNEYIALWLAIGQALDWEIE